MLATIVNEYVPFDKLDGIVISVLNVEFVPIFAGAEGVTSNIPNSLETLSEVILTVSWDVPCTPTAIKTCCPGLYEEDMEDVRKGRAIGVRPVTNSFPFEASAVPCDEKYWSNV